MNTKLNSVDANNYSDAVAHPIDQTHKQDRPRYEGKDRCPECGLFFMSQTQVDRHLAKRHGPVSPKGGNTDAVEANTRNQQATHSPLFAKENPLFVVQNGSQTDIHVKDLVHDRELTLCSDLRPEDAEYIVRAVNNVEALAEALRETFTEYKKGKCEIDASVCIKARAALAKYEADKDLEQKP